MVVIRHGLSSLHFGPPQQPARDFVCCDLRDSGYEFCNRLQPEALAVGRMICVTEIGIGLVGGGYMGKAHAVAMSAVGAVFDTSSAAPA
jgi:hypothetical protein